MPPARSRLDVVSDTAASRVGPDSGEIPLLAELLVFLVAGHDVSRMKKKHTQKMSGVDWWRI